MISKHFSWPLCPAFKCLLLLCFFTPSLALISFFVLPLLVTISPCRWYYIAHIFRYDPPIQCTMECRRWRLLLLPNVSHYCADDLLILKLYLQHLLISESQFKEMRMGWTGGELTLSPEKLLYLPVGKLFDRLHYNWPWPKNTWLSFSLLGTKGSISDIPNAPFWLIAG